MNLCDIEPSRMTGRELLSEHRRLRCKIEKQGERYKGHVDDWLRLGALRRRIDDMQHHSYGTKRARCRILGIYCQ
jgi:hypothetical protein